VSNSAQTPLRLIVAEKAIYYRKVRQHSIELPPEANARRERARPRAGRSAPPAQVSGSLDPIDSAEKAKLLLSRLFEAKPVEGLYAIALNSSGDFLGLVKLAEGTVDRAAVYPRELLTFLLVETNATAVLLAHSHPGGKAEPSPEDLTLTTRLKELLQPLSVRLLDHFIYSCSRPGKEGLWLSMRERGDL
jgi:DNA repair protein RadC